METKITPESLLQGSVKIPSLPEVFLRLDEAISSPRCSIGDIGDILQDDAGLCSRLLRIANSPFYSFPSKIDTITRALTLVGTQQLRDLVLATSVMKTFRDIPAELIDMEMFWRHCIATGVAARVIATYLRESNVEYFYVMGLLHDIGYLIIYTRLPEVAESILNESKETRALLYDLEQKALGFDHADVGSALLQYWKIPDRLREPVALHHKPAASHIYPRETAILHISDVIVHGMRLGFSGEQIIPKIDHEAWSRIGITINVLPVLMQQIEKQYEDAVDVFMLADD